MQTNLQSISLGSLCVSAIIDGLRNRGRAIQKLGGRTYPEIDCAHSEI